MSDDKLRFPDWQIPLQEILLEFDQEKLRVKMQAMEKLIPARLAKISRENDAREERGAINDALAIMRIIKDEKLKSPDRREKSA